MALQPQRDDGLSETLRELFRRRPASADAIFLLRAIRALEHLRHELPEEILAAAAGAESDFDVVLEGMLQAPAIRSAGAQAARPLAAARLRGLRAQATLLEAEGGALTPTETASLLRISRQAVNKRRRAGHLLALPAGRRGFVYPVWQLSHAGALPGLEPVLGGLAGHDPWMQARFFLSPNLRLDGARPLDELRRGNVERVVEVARVYGEHGAA
jgi:hypothetical protein